MTQIDLKVWDLQLGSSVFTYDLTRDLQNSDFVPHLLHTVATNLLPKAMQFKCRPLYL